MEDLQNVNSSNVLPLVSGNNKYTTTISNAIQQQYPAPRPQNWNRERPLARCAYGNSSTMYVYVKALYPMLYAGEYAKMKKMTHSSEMVHVMYIALRLNRPTSNATVIPFRKFQQVMPTFSLPLNCGSVKPMSDRRSSR